MKLLFILLLSWPFFAFSQDFPAEHKTLPAKRTTQKVKVDGKLDDPAWQDAALADDFTEFRPVIGKKWPESIRTEVYLMYDDTGIYVGGHCFESTPDSISRELAGRDGFGANDYIGIIFDTYQDKLNGFEYFVTPLNEQWDAKASSNGEDFSWNAVWESGAIIHDKGWDFEVFIPYSAIRFSKSDKQNWGLQLSRRRRKTEQQNAWNFVNPNVNGFLTQEGTWEGLENIKPPFRLQLFPYLSYYQNHYPANTEGQSNWSQQFAGGLDLKMGLSQAFTLDATLVPDFGQVQSDNHVLNLSPFEVRYNEYRPFFTEGTELFSKGDLFYSRRIGGSTLHPERAYENLKSSEVVVSNPAEAKLFNASKISGRTQKGLGIGVLNAITKRTVAVIKDEETGETREVETDPLTNYNILVLDQNLKHNSSVTFTNTSLIRNSDDYNANVSQLQTSLYDKKNTYNFTGSLGLSHLNYKAAKPNVNGIKYSVGIAKNSGTFTWGITQERVDTNYTSNDLGYFTNNNYLNHDFYAGYRFQEPKGIYNKIFLNFGGWTSRLAEKLDGIEPTFQNAGVRFNFNMQLKKLHWLGLFTNYLPKQNDFYEPRVAGKYFVKGSSYLLGTWLESNSVKKYSLAYEIYHRWTFQFYDAAKSGINLSQNYRFNTKFSLRFEVDYTHASKDVGFMTIEDNEPVFAVRKLQTFSNTFNVKYNFNPKSWLTLRVRHYSSEVKPLQLYSLLNDGTLQERGGLDDSYDRNVNFFNVDMVYTWQFAPGSFLNAVWKNATYKGLDAADFMYFHNLSETLKSDQNNNFSVKVIYFFDYSRLNFKKKG